MKKLKPKVTVASVRREWLERFTDLGKQYDALCDAHRALARAADDHRTAQEYFRKEAQEIQELATERLIELHQKQGVINYLEGKLNGNNN